MFIISSTNFPKQVWTHLNIFISTLNITLNLHIFIFEHTSLHDIESDV